LEPIPALTPMLDPISDPTPINYESSYLTYFNLLGSPMCDQI
jgi:hypothetical protein